MWSYTFYTFSANALELKRWLSHHEDPARAISHAAASGNLFGHQSRADVLRHLHNFLASAKSLVEHTRNFITSTYAETSLLHDYHREVREKLAPSGVLHFVHDLRNYMLHKGIPLTREQFAWSRDSPETFTITFDLTRLRSWRRWSPEALDYLTHSPDHVRIADIVEEYTELVVRFHKWLNERRKQEDAAVFAELAALQDELATELDRKPSPPSDADK